MPPHPGPPPRQDPSAALVVRGPAHGPRPSAIVNLVVGIVTVVVAMAAVTLTALYGILWVAALSAAPLVFLGCWHLYAWAAFNRARRDLADTDLWLSAYGVAYACPAGWYAVPWSAVGRIEFRAWPGPKKIAAEALCVDTTGWAGPIKRQSSALRGLGKLAIAVGPGNRPAVARAVHAATGGRVALPPY